MQEELEHPQENKLVVVHVKGGILRNIVGLMEPARTKVKTALVQEKVISGMQLSKIKWMDAKISANHVMENDGVGWKTTGL